MILAAVDSVLTQQVFITGQVQDAVSGRPPLSPLTIQLQFQAAPQAPYPLQLRQAPGGYYSFFGNPITALPVLSDPDTLDLQLTVSADRYETETLALGFTAADLALGELTRTIDGQLVSMPQRTALPRIVDVSLTPLPLVLSGRVVRSDDPNVAVPGATVSVTAPSPAGPAICDGNGAYVLPNLPVAAEITVEVASAGFSTLTTTVRLDYRQPVNERHFRLA